ncbi:hypothetical protein [Paenibacillus silvisoli]|uniref:hypothetical protein n=1 Tax=Paenibacillus silvisoli TaxID=3110539 RepID=UPI0028064654|nr:hypothetical protein [Paenibacillus silvisoli]
MDNIHRADGMSFVDKGMILAFMFSTIGASKGFVWRGGPVIWGITGAFVGFIVGTLLSWIIYVIKHDKNQMQIKKGKKGMSFLS